MAVRVELADRSFGTKVAALGAGVVMLLIAALLAVPQEAEAAKLDCQRVEGSNQVKCNGQPRTGDTLNVDWRPGTFQLNVELVAVSLGGGWAATGVVKNSMGAPFSDGERITLTAPGGGLGGVSVDADPSLLAANATSSSLPVEALTGGIAGGVAVIAFAGAAWYVRRRRID